MDSQPSKEWWYWYLAPLIDYKKVYGDAFEWTKQELELMAKLKEKNGGQD